MTQDDLPFEGVKVLDLSQGIAGPYCGMHLARNGADVIKADPTDDVSLYHRVIQVAGDTPVLVRGGGKVSDREILQRTAALLEQGASGIVYGRNIIQHSNPAAITKALMGMVHDGLGVEEAVKLVAGR